MLHVSSGIPRDRTLTLPEGFEYDNVVYAGCQVKKHVGVPVISVSGIRTLRRGNAMIENGCHDLVAYGRPFLADAGFVKKSRVDPDYEPCLRCRRCQWYKKRSFYPNRNIDHTAVVDAVKW